MGLRHGVHLSRLVDTIVAAYAVAFKDGMAGRLRRGDSYANALAETINGLYKAELIHRRAPWKTKESLELATLEWVSWFNHHRLLEPIGYIPPAEAEENYYRQLTSQTATTE
jgi:putative transposase